MTSHRGRLLSRPAILVAGAHVGGPPAPGLARLDHGACGKATCEGVTACWRGWTAV